jgi:hypothetical protein
MIKLKAFFISAAIRIVLSFAIDIRTPFPKPGGFAEGFYPLYQ